MRRVVDGVLGASVRSRRVRRVALFACVGAVAGLLASGYSLALDGLTALATGEWLGFGVDRDGPLGALRRPWLLPILTTLVGLATGWLIQRFTPQTDPFGVPGDSKRTGTTDGTDAMIKAFHQGDGRIAPRAAVIRTATSILTLSCGGSAGKEGPVAFMGAGFGSWLAQRLNLTDSQRRILLLAGAAGGLGAIFRSPLGAALTAVEVLYAEDFEGEALLPAIISSVCAYMVFTVFNGTDPLLTVPDPHPAAFGHFPFYLLLALACAGSAWLYTRGFSLIKYKVFLPLRKRLGPVKAMGLGGLAAGLAGVACPAVIGSSHASLEMAMLDQLPGLVLLALLAGKILATSLTIGSGFSGGMFAPGLFVGGMTGGLVGKVCQAFWPGMAAGQSSFVLVGMSAFFACAAKAPIGPLIMVCELSQGYALLAPLLFCTAVALSLSSASRLYENQLPSKLNSPVHSGEAVSAALELHSVREVYTPGQAVVLEEATTLAALSDILKDTSVTAFPVRGLNGGISGLLDVRDARAVIFEHGLHHLVVVGELARPPETLTPDQTLQQALMAFVRAGTDQLPVVDARQPSLVLGVLNLRDVMAAAQRGE